MKILIAELIHKKIEESGEFEEWSGWSLSTTRSIIVAMGFRFRKPHARQHALLIESPYVIGNN